MFNRGLTSIIIVFAVLQHPMGSNGEENRICYIKKNQQQTAVCGSPSTVSCCDQNLSVDRINVYGVDKCNSISYCGTGEGCCVSRDILNVSAEFVLSLEQAFRRTRCFKYVTLNQLPAISILTSVVVSFSCTDDTSKVTTAVVVSVSIVVVAVVVVVTVIYLRRKRAGGSTTMAHDPVKTSTSGTQYVNVVSPTYEQLSLEHTDGEYSELSKNERDCTHGDRLQQGQQWGNRVDQSVYYNETQPAGNDGDYVIVV